MGRGVSSIPNDDPERLARIQDAKFRTIGVDKQALDAQALEKRAREEEERMATMHYTKLAAYFADQVQLKEQEALMLKKDALKEIEDFRKDNQSKDKAREWDLNDPEALRNAPPPRTNDDQAPVSGLQMFDGEDLTVGDRTKAQMDQNRDWWNQQTREKEAIKAAERQENLQYGALLKAQEDLQKDFVQQEKDLRKQLSAEQMKENMRLAEERAARDRKRQQENLEMNKNEQIYQATNQFLTEDPDCATSSLSAARFRPDHFKGYSPDNAREVRDYQQMQVEEKAARKAQQLADEMAYARYMNAVNKALTERERSAADFKKKQMDAAAMYMQKQATEKRDRDNFLTNTLYTNEPDASY
eukprot:CAMPEP_0117669206 /NCGR_PEP_ID=MMETSP0804-20121206/11994_1 /TAXON_ID=1074897 /ORGANISM="Tetraselmis astigmatica, Strain CCMP880" /LENGTH=357 /DNA_ID=CAMNT_0005477219 /DNA_START=171 /DNA_END=1241 /DNA_ORIENTATION=+